MPTKRRKRYAATVDVSGAHRTANNQCAVCGQELATMTADVRERAAGVHRMCLYRIASRRHDGE